MDLSNNSQIDSQSEILKQQILLKKQQHNNRIKIEAVNMICRQTDYSQEEAKEKLEGYNYNYQLVLNDFFNIKEKQQKKQTTNQIIYTEIRGLMDAGAKNFRIKQETEKKYQEYIENKNKLK
jgi:hypothetical protein